MIGAVVGSLVALAIVHYFGTPGAVACVVGVLAFWLGEESERGRRNR